MMYVSLPCNIELLKGSCPISSIRRCQLQVPLATDIPSGAGGIRYLYASGGTAYIGQNNLMGPAGQLFAPYLSTLMIRVEGASAAQHTSIPTRAGTHFFLS